MMPTSSNKNQPGKMRPDEGRVLNASKESDNKENSLVGTADTGCCAKQGESSQYLDQLGIGNDVLVLGDGNLTFSLALSQLFPGKKISATVFEEEDEWLQKYGDIGKNILCDIREHFPHTKVIFEVDATKLAPQPIHGNSFTDIFFNFPHHGGKTNLKKSRILLRQLFESVAKNVMNREGRNRFHLTLAPAQSGLDPKIVRESRYFSDSPPEHKKDSWQPLELAAEYGLVATAVERFNPELFPGYKASGYLNTDQAFNNADDAHTITFKWIGYLTNFEKMRLSTAKFLEVFGSKIRAPPYDQIPHPIFHQFRPFHQYHLSIVFGRSHNTKDEEYMTNLELFMFRSIHQMAGPFLVRIFELPKKRCFAPRNLVNRIYCLQYQGISVPLCRDIANHMHQELTLRMGSLFDGMNSDIQVSIHLSQLCF